MIKIDFRENEDISHNIFELLRNLFPSYEWEKELYVKVSVIDKYRIDIVCDKFNETVFVEKIDDKTAQKFLIKQKIYMKLKKYFEYSESWGILTGVKPIKLIMKLLRENGEDETRNLLLNYYLLSAENVDMTIEIAKREMDIVYPLDRNRYSLYIHIPFCPTKCSYCSFLTMKNSVENTEIYTKTLIEELKRDSDYVENPPHTIYIGGGTPTAIKSCELEEIIKTVNTYYGKSEEFTVECGRPDTIDKDILQMLKEQGVNRISINPQSMKDETLNRIGRSHNIDEIIESYNDARDIGFDSINMDMILGLPGESKEDILYSLDEIIKLKPENITIHTLAVKNGSKLFTESYNNISESNDILRLTKEIAKVNGYNPYYLYRQKRMLKNGENIGYALPGFESIYNIIMMEEKETVIGAGMCSTSKIYDPSNDRHKKIMQYRNFKDYIEKGYLISDKKIRQIEKFEF